MKNHIDRFRNLLPWLAIAAMTSPLVADRSRAAEANYARDVAPLLNKYCAGCHNDGDREGGFSVQSYASLQRGGDGEPSLVPGNPRASKLLRLIRGEAKPAMPPEDEPQPTPAEVQVLANWIDQGAVGPSGAEAKLAMNPPRIEPPADLRKPITSLDWSPTGLLAVGTYGKVELRIREANVAVPLGNLPGKVTSVRFSPDGKLLVTTSGATGLAGWTAIWDAKSGRQLMEFRGHYDVVQTAAISHDNKVLATGSYDRRILLWDIATGALLRELGGHNGAIYDLDFNRDGTVLASASGDETVKLWRVADGQRLDTLSQPEKEQYTVRFSPDDKFIVAGGADNRIRVWRFVSRDKPRINPLAYARFAHEGAVSHIRFAEGGRLLVSAAEDKTLKVWTTSDYTQRRQFPVQRDVVGAMAVSSQGALAVGRLDGELLFLDLPRIDEGGPIDEPAAPQAAADAPMPQAEILKLTEQEPNGSAATAQRITVPAAIQGTIHAEGGDGDSQATDDDLYRFAAKAGQTWVLEVNAARSKSKLDSRIEVLDGDGQPVPQVLLQAMRDSYFTFRGKDSNTSDDFRVHNWREMELNQLLYCNGEVVRLWHYPRGPDSGFIVYPGSGSRRTYFGTTAMAHALHEPCYIVEPLPVGSQPLPNGLPVFPVYYENDDDPLREWGADSRLAFTAPTDGEYVVRVTDIRGEAGADYRYTLTVRPQQPRFQVSVGGSNPTLNAGSGKEVSFTVKRIDGFQGPVTIEVENLPPGIRCYAPVTIEAEQMSARTVLWAATGAQAPSEEQWKAIRIRAHALIDGMEASHDLGNFGAIKVAEAPQAAIQVVHHGQQEPDTNGSLMELTIAPGETITAEVVATRAGYNGRISLGKHDAGRNMPHGVFVDNIGLNGLMILDGQTRREFFITAAPFVPEQTRLFHLRSAEAGNQTTQPVILHVRRK